MLQIQIFGWRDIESLDDKISKEVILMRREQKAKPVLAEIKALLDNPPFKLPPKSPLGTAVFYSLNHWDALNITEKGGVN